MEKRRLKRKQRLLAKHTNPVVDWNDINFRYYLIQRLWKWGNHTLKPEWPLPHPEFWKRKKILKRVKRW